MTPYLPLVDLSARALNLTPGSYSDLVAETMGNELDATDGVDSMIGELGDNTSGLEAEIPLAALSIGAAPEPTAALAESSVDGIIAAWPAASAGDNDILSNLAAFAGGIGTATNSTPSSPTDPGYTGKSTVPPQMNGVIDQDGIVEQLNELYALPDVFELGPTVTLRVDAADAGAVHNVGINTIAIDPESLGGWYVAALGPYNVNYVAAGYEYADFAVLVDHFGDYVLFARITDPGGNVTYRIGATFSAIPKVTAPSGAQGVAA